MGDKLCNNLLCEHKYAGIFKINPDVPYKTMWKIDASFFNWCFPLSFGNKMDFTARLTAVLLALSNRRN